MERLGFLREHLDLTTVSVLELGALDRPIVTPDVAQVRYLDHLDTAGLKAKYATDPAVDKARIVDVGYVHDDGPMSAAVTDGRRFDVVVASHVFEHLCDPIGWLLDAQKMLADDGHIFLVLPDRRFTFDLRRSDTSLSDWVGWHLRGLRRPAPDQVFDHFAQVCSAQAGRIWRGAGVDEFRPMYEIGQAYDIARSVAAEDRYVDVHCSVFTPFSYVGLCMELARLNLFPYRFAGFQPTAPDSIEFLVLLQAARTDPMPVVDQAAQRDLARRAGYQGEFGGGRFRQALDGDPALQKRFEALLADAQSAIAAEWEKRAAGNFPDLDPALHHDRPRRGDPRVG